MKQRILFLLGIGISLMSMTSGCMRLQAEETDETGGTKIIEITQSGSENGAEIPAETGRETASEQPANLSESFRIDDVTGSVVWMTEDWLVTEQLLMTEGQIGYDTVIQVYAIATREKTLEIQKAWNFQEDAYYAEEEFVVKNLSVWERYDYEGNLRESIDWKQIITENLDCVEGILKETFSSDLKKYVYCIQVSEKDSIYDRVYVYDTDTKQNQMLWEWSEYPVVANQIGFRDFRIASDSDVIAFVGYYFPSADIGTHSTSCYGVYDSQSDEMIFTIDDVDILLDQKNGLFLFYHNDGIEAGKPYQILYDSKSGEQKRIDLENEEECYHSFLSWDGSMMITYMVQNQQVIIREYDVSANQILAEYSLPDEEGNSPAKELYIYPDGYGIYITEGRLIQIPYGGET